MASSDNWQSVQRSKTLLNSLARKAVRIYPRTSYTDRKAVNALRRGWIDKITYLGPKWLLPSANSVQKRQAGVIDVDTVVFIAVTVIAWAGYLSGAY